MLGHLGINVPDLKAAKGYYDAVMPLLGFDEHFTAEDEFAYRPAGGKTGTYLFFYPSAEDSGYTRQRTGLQHLSFMVRTRSLVTDAHALATDLIPHFGGDSFPGGRSRARHRCRAGALAPPLAIVGISMPGRYLPAAPRPLDPHRRMAYLSHLGGCSQ